MKNSIKTYAVLFLALCMSFLVQGQDEPDSDFDKHKAFSPLFMNEYANSFHSATGKPGPDYWQNQSDYKIKATLDTVDHEINGEVTITYTNNSPYDLEFLWLQLDQNSFTLDSKSAALYPSSDRNGLRYPTDGYQIESVSINGGKADYIIDDTRMQIRLDKDLKADGKKAEIHIAYSFEIPTHGKDRMGRVETENGWIYTLAQWYPRMAVYDEVEGWNNLPYLGTGEFYLEYGDFDYEITAPDNMVVVGSGELENPKKVLTKEQRKRLKEAQKSDETVDILSKEEMLESGHPKKGKDGMLTWHFKMDNSRDVAWAASKGFIWDAARINLPDDKTALAQSVYPAENSGQDGYGRSTEYTKHAVEISSKNWYPYPYKVATNVGAHEGGMEYPGLVFCSYESKDESLWGVINHEFGHTWFPMIVGSDERKHAWLDEGLNSFTNDVATEEFNDGEYHNEQNQQQMGSQMFNKSLDPLFTRSDVIHDQRKLAIEAYFKPSTAMHVLRNVVLGRDRFDYALKTYIKRWAYKHPTPWDFFNTMSNASGEDLGWFFKGWFMENWAIDQAVKSIDYVDGDYKNGAEITLANKGEMPMPVELEVTFKDESTTSVKLPVEIWMTGPEYVYTLDSNKEVKTVEIDPSHQVPDTNPSNNIYKLLTSAPEDQNVDKVINSYLEAIGGRDNLENLKDLTLEMGTTIQGTPITIKEQIKKPDKFLREITVQGQTLQKLLVNGNDISAVVQGEEQELNEEDKDILKSLSDERYIELKYDQEGYKSELLGVDSVDGEETYVVEITTPDGQTLKNYYSTETGLKIQEHDAEGNKKQYSDYQDVDGIKFPFKSQESMSGQQIESTVQKAEINQGLEDSEFQ